MSPGARASPRAAGSYDEGTTWLERRLLAPEGKTTTDGSGYPAATQGRDGTIHPITGKAHSVFNLARVGQIPATPTTR
jgi:hypothetical protein